MRVHPEVMIARLFFLAAALVTANAIIILWGCLR